MTGMRTGALPMLPGALGQVGAAVGLKYCGDGAARARRAMTSMATESRVACIFVVAAAKRRISGGWCRYSEEEAKRKKRIYRYTDL